MNNETLIKLTGINKSFGPTKALVDVTLELRRGEVRGLIGENGSGKSTLATIIAGAQPADSGEMLLGGEAYRPASMLEGERRGVGMVVQELGTVSGISIAENLYLGRLRAFGKLGFVNRRRLMSTARAALADMGLSDMDPSRSVDSLDLQDRKLVEVARVMIGKPELFILDETTTALSQRGRAIVYELIKKLKAENKAVLFVSHDLEEIMETCDAVTVLRDGHLVENVDRKDFSESKIKQLMIGREIAG